MGAYAKGDATVLTDGFKKAGKKLDMGKSCIRFRTADDLALDAIGAAIASLPVDQYVAFYEATRPKSQRKDRQTT